MAAVQFSCPKCKSRLNSATPIPAGANLKCPKCGMQFRYGAGPAPACPAGQGQQTPKNAPVQPAAPPPRAFGPAGGRRGKNPGGSRRKLVAVLAVVGLLVLAGGGYLAWDLLNPPEKTTVTGNTPPPKPNPGEPPVHPNPDPKPMPHDPVDPKPTPMPVDPKPMPMPAEPKPDPNEFVGPPRDLRPDPKPPVAMRPTEPPDMPLYDGKPLKEWTKALAAADEPTRRQALTALAKAGPNAVWALAPLHTVLVDDANPELRLLAASAIGAIGPWAAPAVPGLCELLEDKAEPLTVRQACVKALGEIGPGAGAAASVLVGLLADVQLGGHAVIALTRIGEPAVPVLVKSIQDGDRSVRDLLAQALGDIGPSAKVAIPTLIELLQDDRPGVATQARAALWKIAPTDPRLVAACISALRVRDGLMQIEGASDLLRFGPLGAPAVPELIAAFDSGEDAVRAAAALALAGIGPAAKGATPALVARLKDRSPAVRQRAIAALGCIHGQADKAIPALVELLNDPMMQTSVIDALGLYGPDAAPAIPELIRLMKQDSSIQYNAQACLVLIGAPAVPALVEALADAEPRVRRRAAEALLRLQTDAEPALAALAKAIKDTDSEVRRCSLESLTHLAPAAKEQSAEFFRIMNRDEFGNVRKAAAAALSANGVDPKDIEPLLALTRLKVPEARLAAAVALGGAGEKGVEALAQLAQDEDEGVRNAAKATQARLANAPKIAALRKALKDPGAAADGAARRKAARELLELAPGDPTALKALAAALSEKAPEVRCEAASALATSRKLAARWEVIAGLVLALRDPTPEVGKAAVDALLAIDSNRVEFLLQVQPLPKPPPALPPVAAPTPPPIEIAALPPRTRLSAAAEAATTTKFRLFVPAKNAPAGARPVVVFERPVELGPPTADVHRGILVRELVRQSVLLCFREELRFVTRDLTLREVVPPPEDFTVDGEFELSSICLSGRQLLVCISRRTGDKPQLVWSKRMPLRQGELFDYNRVAEDLERVSREELPAALKQAGLEARPSAPSGDAANSASARQLLARMNYASQFLALRETHAGMREKGESAELLGDLVRGYAHLGVLTEFHWNSAHKACKARALLYAARLATRDPKSALGRWHRAYACALAGLHDAALAELDQARKLAAAPAAPDWVELLDAYCRFDAERLTAVAAKHGQLGKLLDYLALEDPTTPSLTLKAAQALLQDNPECYRVLDAVCRLGSIDVLHKATLVGPEILAKSLPAHLHAAAGLPQPVRAALAERDRPGAEPKYVQALLEAAALGKDANEPALSSLAWMVRDSRFAFACQRLSFMKNVWAVPTDDYLRETLPVLEAHPYRPFLETFAQPGPAAQAGARAMAEVVDSAELERPQSEPLIPFVSRPGAGPILLDRHQDDTYPDFVGLFDSVRAAASMGKLPSGNLPMTPAAASKFQRLSPHSPSARAVLIAWNWLASEPHVTEWEKAAARQPAVLGALGRRYLQQKQFENGERCLEQYLRLVPDAWAFRQLSQHYRATGRIDKWRETLDDFFKRGDDVLMQAGARVEIARFYMAKKEFKTALLYAEDAAQTYAAFAMKCASECHEGLENWEKSELWIRRVSERYVEFRGDWLAWCKRTGKGDVQAAMRLAAGRVSP